MGAFWPVASHLNNQIKLNNNKNTDSDWFSFFLNFQSTMAMQARLKSNGGVLQDKVALSAKPTWELKPMPKKEDEDDKGARKKKERRSSRTGGDKQRRSSRAGGDSQRTPRSPTNNNRDRRSQRDQRESNVDSAIELPAPPPRLQSAVESKPPPRVIQRTKSSIAIRDRDLQLKMGVAKRIAESTKKQRTQMNWAAGSIQTMFRNCSRRLKARRMILKGRTYKHGDIKPGLCFGWLQKKTIFG